MRARHKAPRMLRRTRAARIGPPRPAGSTCMMLRAARPVTAAEAMPVAATAEVATVEAAVVRGAAEDAGAAAGGKRERRSNWKLRTPRA